MKAARCGNAASATRLLLAGAMAAALFGCAAPSAPGGSGANAFERAYARLQTYLDDCSKSVGVDPRTAKGVGERELLPREREWRSCAYEGIRSVLVPTTRHPELYGQLIAEDQSMTERIAKGSMTRTERRARLDQLHEMIAQKEGQSGAELSQEQAQRNAQLVRQVRGLP